MKVSKWVKGMALMAVAAGASMSAHAGYVVLDGWELVTPTADIKLIGRLNLVSGTATVEQEVNATNAVFVGAKFREDGFIYSVTYTKENTVGAGDSGPPKSLIDSLTISFSNVTGVVDTLNVGGGYHYTFQTGSFTIAGDGGNYASGSIVGIGGNASATGIIGGFNGDSTLLASILSAQPGFDIKDSGGVSLLPQLAAGQVLFESVTNNNTTLPIPVSAGACTFTPASAPDTCVSVNVASAGDSYLVKVPEPGALALSGLALFGAFAASRRRKA